MLEDLRLIQRPTDAWDGFQNPFGAEAASAARRFHRSVPEYAPTPLVRLSALARTLGVASVQVKDERPRFGRNAFKVLGGSYCIGRYIQSRFGLEHLSFEALTRPALRAEMKDLTFVTATDGNHGRGIAWTANRLGLKSVVYMPKGLSLLHI